MKQAPQPKTVARHNSAPPSSRARQVSAQLMGAAQFADLAAASPQVRTQLSRSEALQRSAIVKSQKRMQNHANQVPDQADLAETEGRERESSLANHVGGDRSGRVQLPSARGGGASERQTIPGKSAQRRARAMQRVVQRNGLEVAAFKKEIIAALSAELTVIAKANWYWTYGLRYQATVDAYIDGELNKLIARYGLENRDLIRLRIKERAGTLTAKASRLVAYLDAARAELPKVMDTQENLANLKEALISSSASKELTEAVVPELDEARVKLLWAQLKANLVQVEKRIRGDWKSIQRGFGIKGKLQWIHLTGSDFHNKGQSVSIAESDLKEKVVYKPRSLAPDMAVAAQGESVFKALTERGSEAGISLPTTRFQQEGDQHGEYGYMEFLQQAPVMSEAAAQAYYYQLGQLAVAAKLLGITDLHQENVLSGNGAPFVIDAETSFLPYVMLADGFKATGLQDTLTDFKKSGKDTVNAFLTVKENAEFDKLSRAKPTISRQNFLEQKRRDVLAGKSPLSPYFLEGIKRMLMFVSHYREPLTKYLLEQATRTQHVRIVPIDTLAFKGYLRTYVTKPAQQGNVANAVIKDLTQELDARGFAVLKEALTQAVTAGLDQDFKRGDLPLFHYEPAHEGIFYKGVQIAATKKGATLADAIPRVITRLTKTSVEDVVNSYSEP